MHVVICMQYNVNNTVICKMSDKRFIYGNIFSKNGDQDTLGWPAHSSSYKNKSSIDAGIIAQPITGRDARVLLEKLEENPNLPLPDSWRANIMTEGKEYHVGNGSTVLLEVSI